MHAVVVVALELVELVLDAARGARAERLGDEPLLAGGVDALLLEDRRDAASDGDLGEDVGERVGQPAVREALVDDPLAVLAQQLLALVAQALDLVADRAGEVAERLVGAA